MGSESHIMALHVHCGIRVEVYIHSTQLTLNDATALRGPEEVATVKATDGTLGPFANRCSAITATQLRTT